MGFYSPLRQNVRIDSDDRFELREEVDSFLQDIQEGQMQTHIDNVMTSHIGKRIVRGLLEEGYSHKEVEQMFLEAAKKSKKKKKKEDSKSDSKDDSDIDVDDVGNSSDIPKSDTDDDSDSKKKDKKKDTKSKDKDDDSDTDDLDIDDDSDDDSDSDSKKSKKKDKKKDKKSKDSDDDSDIDVDDEPSIEDKSDSKKSKKKDKKSKDKDSDTDDDSDSKDSDSKSKTKSKKSKDDSDSGDDDLKLEQVDLNSFSVNRKVKFNYRSMLETAMDKEYKLKTVSECECGSCSSCKAKARNNGKSKIKDMKSGPKNGVRKSTDDLSESFRWRLPPGYIPPDKNKYWDKIVMEHFDLKDDKTRVVLITCDEDAQSEVLHSLTDRLYDVIVDKAATIDYGTIRESRGDIQSLQNYGKLEECVELLHQLLIECKQDTNPVDEIKMAMDNIYNRSDMFKKCYMSNVDFGMLTYETMTMAVIASTSLMLSTSVEFIKSANNENYQITLDRVGMSKVKNHLLFTNLKRFNVMCADKSFDKTMDTILIEYGKNLLGLSTMSGLAVAALVTVVLYNFLPMLRELTYFFYYTRTRLSDYFNLQADLLEINAHDIEANQKNTVGDRKTVVRRQRAIADKFRSIADFFMVDSKQAEQKATQEISNDRRKLKTDDVLEDIPDNSKSSLF